MTSSISAAEDSCCNEEKRGRRGREAEGEMMYYCL